jgi:hypothetical protein
VLGKVLYTVAVGHIPQFDEFITRGGQNKIPGREECHGGNIVLMAEKIY